MNCGERRRALRYPVAVRVEMAEGAGLTRDASLSGVFFETDLLFLPDEPIRLVLVFERLVESPPLRLECEGRVVRVESSDEKVGVAASINTIRFGPSGVVFCPVGV